MNAVLDDKQHRLDLLKWAVVAVIVGGAIFANHYFKTEPLLYRVLGLLALGALAAAIALRTERGAAFLELAKGARVEAGRVVWPTRQERNQTTLIVLGFILVMALLLWGLDTLFGWLAAMIIG